MKTFFTKKYSAVTLVEMLMTLIIITIVMVLVAVTLNTMIKASIMSNARTTTRQESEFILELLRKTVRNSDASEIRIYSVSGRLFDSNTQRTVDNNVSGYDFPITTEQSGTEIHFRPFGFSGWVCVGFFQDTIDPNKGYILKSSRQDLDIGSECFNSGSSQYLSNTFVLNSEAVHVNNFAIRYVETLDENYLMTIDLEMEPVHWVPNGGNIRPEYFQQAVVSTQKLTWEN